MSRSKWIPVGIAGAALAMAGWGVITAQSLAKQLTEVQGKLTPAASQPAPAKEGAVDIRKTPWDLPGAITRKESQKVVVSLETVETVGKLADGTTYTYWTFNKTVPGPMVRVREGDTVEVHLKNSPTSTQIHSIDLHAVTGPGGGAASAQAKPGEEKVFSFKALNPGVYVYHCATPHIPSHIAQGMYGMIVVEPKDGLAPVDKEFYVMQGEVYASGPVGQKGHHELNSANLSDEMPNYVVFNGAFQALTGDMTMKAKVGDRIRIFVGNGGPNLVSSFHIIGEIFDKVHPEGATEALSNVQTTLIPAGGATWVEFKAEVPGRYQLVDHSISRAINKGAVGFLEVEGQVDTTIYHDPNGHPMPGMGGH